MKSIILNRPVSPVIIAEYENYASLLVVLVGETQEDLSCLFTPDPKFSPSQMEEANDSWQEDGRTYYNLKLDQAGITPDFNVDNVFYGIKKPSAGLPYLYAGMLHKNMTPLSMSIHQEDRGVFESIARFSLTQIPTRTWELIQLRAHAGREIQFIDESLQKIWRGRLTKSIDGDVWYFKCYIIQ